VSGGFGHAKKIYFLAPRLFVALNWAATIPVLIDPIRPVGV
jgi:hypothetical protein